jgi:hypothetical protein
MQKQQAQHYNAQVAALNCNSEVAGATLLSRTSRRNTVMQKQQALHCNAKAAGTKI